MFMCFSNCLLSFKHFLNIHVLYKFWNGHFSLVYIVNIQGKQNNNII